MTTPFLSTAHRPRPPAAPASRAAFALALGIGLAASVVACKTVVPNPNHCSANDGNQTCAERHDGALPYCATTCDGKDPEHPISPNEDGCVDWAPPDGCYSPCGGEVDVTEDDSCLDVAGTESSTDPSGPTSGMTTMESDPTTNNDASETQGVTSETQGTATDTDTDTGPTGCASSDECTDPDAPLCVDELCVACGQAAQADDECAAKDPGFPACGASGACVECTDGNPVACDGETPVCDAEACRGCVDHGECGDTACAFSTGECFPGDCVVDVPADEGTIANAVGSIADGGFCVVRLAENGGVDYDESVVIDGGKRIALLNAGGSEVVIQGVGAATFAVTDASELYLERLLVSDGSDVGLEVSGNGSGLFVEQTEVVQNAGGGITVAGGGYLRLRNSIVGGNGAAPALSVAAGVAELVDVTAVGVGINGRALTCGVAGSAAVRNSILFGEDDADELDCSDAVVTYSASEQAIPGMGNESVALTTDSFDTWLSANFHLSGAGAGIVADIARWTTGDPLVDIDGEARAAVDGTMEHAGADIP